MNELLGDENSINRYKLVDCLNDGCISTGIATTIEEKLGRLSVVTNRYLLQGYLSTIKRINIDFSADDVLAGRGNLLLKRKLTPEIYEKFMEEGLLFRFLDGSLFYYIDAYEWQSIPFVAKTNEGFVGSARLILNIKDPERGFSPIPTVDERLIMIYEKWQKRIHTIRAELSQLAKTKDSNQNVTLSLLRILQVYSSENQIKDWVAIIDNKIIRIFNGFFFNFDIPIIGPSTFYLGSDSSPILINIENALENAAAKSISEERARFIKGGFVKGYEWHIGL